MANLIAEMKRRALGREPDPPTESPTTLIDELFGDVPDSPKPALAETPAAEKIELSPTPHTCPTCQLAITWFSIYRDGIRRCAICEPPPAPRFILGCMVGDQTLGEYTRQHRLEQSMDEHDSKTDFNFEFGSIDPWSPETKTHFDHHEHFGWPMFVLKNEFRKVLATRGRSGR